MGVDRRARHVLARPRVGHVDGDGESSERLRHVLGGLHVGDHDPRACVGEALRDPAPDALRGAGDDRDPPLEAAHRRSSDSKNGAGRIRRLDSSDQHRAHLLQVGLPAGVLGEAAAAHGPVLEALHTPRGARPG